MITYHFISDRLIGPSSLTIMPHAFFFWSRFFFFVRTSQTWDVQFDIMMWNYCSAKILHIIVWLIWEHQLFSSFFFSPKRKEEIIIKKIWYILRVLHNYRIPCSPGILHQQQQKGCSSHLGNLERVLLDGEFLGPYWRGHHDTHRNESQCACTVGDQVPANSLWNFETGSSKGRREGGSM